MAEIDEFKVNKIVATPEGLVVHKLQHVYKLGEVVNLVDFDFDPGQMEIYILEEVDNEDEIVSVFSVVGVRDMRKTATTEEFNIQSSIMVTSNNYNHVISLEINQSICTAIKRDVNSDEVIGKCKCFTYGHSYYLTLQAAKFFFVAPANKAGKTEKMVVLNQNQMQVVSRLCLPAGQSVKGLCVNKGEEFLFVLAYDLRDPDNAKATIQQFYLNQTINEEMAQFEGTVTHKNSVVHNNRMYTADKNGTFAAISMDAANDTYEREKEVSFQNL